MIFANSFFCVLVSFGGLPGDLFAFKLETPNSKKEHNHKRIDSAETFNVLATGLDHRFGQQMVSAETVGVTV
jgi:hypothetical protein